MREVGRDGAEFAASVKGAGSVAVGRVAGVGDFGAGVVAEGVVGVVGGKGAVGGVGPVSSS